MTADSSLTGRNSTPTASASSRVADPHGTPSAQTTNRAPSRDASSPVIPAGLPGGVMSVSTLVANGTGSPATSPASTARFMVATSAAANTSAGAPPAIWSTRPLDPPKLSRIDTPGSDLSTCSAISVNAPLNEAAANTVRSPPSSSSPPDAHPASRDRPTTATIAAARHWRPTAPGEPTARPISGSW